MVLAHDPARTVVPDSPGIEPKASNEMRMRRTTSYLRIFAAAGFAVCAVASPSLGQDFYEASAAELRGRPGTIIRSEPMSGTPAGASAFRVLYRSTGLRGEPIAVSGSILVPDGPVPPGGRRVVAWAHGTTGIARRCAPSLAAQPFASIAGLEAMLARGYVVAATDYPGLGTAGMHPYLIGESGGRAVLDSVRAARQLPGADAGAEFAVWGHSQGGHAALFTGELARRYTPELRLAGVGAAAPATELGELFRADIRGIAGKVLGAFAIRSWSAVFDIPLAGVVLERSMLVFERVATFCIDGETLPLFLAEQPLEREGFLAVDVTKIEPWRGIMRANTPGQAPASAPVFLAQGTADRVVRPRVTGEFMRILCGQGTPVRFLSVPGGDHDASAKRGAAPAVAWIADRFAGAPPPDDC
jgi:alpha-beta hydrolase superfamily lysophospholipase